VASLTKRFREIGRGEARLGFDPLGEREPRLAQIRVKEIERDPTQPRKDMGDLSGLQASIAAHGVLEPVIVSPLDEERYLLIAGERRLTAATLLGLPTVPAIIRTVEEHERLEIQLVENLHRKDLNPVEEAMAYRRLMDEFGLTQRDLAQRVGKSVAVINETLRILGLPEEVLAAVRTSEHATKSLLLEIAKQPEVEDQIGLWQQAQRGQLTVKKARERKLRDRKSPPPRCDIYLATATVTVQFKTEPATPRDVARALHEALETYVRDNALSTLDPAPERAEGEDAMAIEAVKPPEEIPTNGHHHELEATLFGAGHPAS
jgi:ParB family chromosome partitioning protein